MSANKRKIKNLYRHLKGDLKMLKPLADHIVVLDNGTRVAPEVKAGDEVVFAKYSGTEFKYDGKDYLILSERDVLAVL